MATYRFAESVLDTVGAEGPCSTEITVEAIPGQSITLTLPDLSGDPSVSKKLIYRSFMDDSTGDLYFIQSGTNSGAPGGAAIVDPDVMSLTVSTDDFDLDITKPCRDPASFGTPPVGARYVKFVKNRLHYAGTPTNKSRRFVSVVGDADTMEVGFSEDLGGGDDQEITGMAIVAENPTSGVSSSQLVFFRTSSIFVLSGDPTQADTIQRISDLGNAVENSIVETAGEVLFISHRGLMAFDGYSVRRLDRHVADLFRSFIGAKRTSAIQHERVIRWSREHDTDPTKTVCVLYDLDFQSFRKYEYPSRPTHWLDLTDQFFDGSITFPRGLYAATDVPTPSSAPIVGGLKRYQVSNTDEGTPITSFIRTVATSPDRDPFSETRTQEVQVDVTASSTDTITGQARIDSGSGDTDTFTAVPKGTARRQLLKFPLSHKLYGRYVDVTLTWIGSCIIHRIYGVDRRPFVKEADAK